MHPRLSTTSYALLGLLVFDGATSTAGLTGYELKQRSDKTLAFYWVSPAMSQIYTELSRLHREELVAPVDARQGRRTTRRYRVTAPGRQALTDWLLLSEADFPVLKHPVALRLMMGHLLPVSKTREMLQAYVDRLVVRHTELQAVRESLGDDVAYRYPAMVAEWGMAYYDAEVDIVAALVRRLDDR